LEVVIAILLGLITTAPVSAASSANLSRSYMAEGDLKNGSILSLDPNKTGYVQVANVNNGSRLVGVATASSDSLLAVDVTSGKVQVATSGSTVVLVSTLNGDIKAGDQIAVSPFNGIGMEAPPGARVIGVATTDFNAGTAGAATQTVTNKQGHSSQIYVGSVRLNINIGINSTGIGNNVNSLQKLVRTITGSTVPMYRIVISLAIIGVALITMITLIYGSIYGSIISIGRNPLAKYDVFRTLAGVIGMILLTAGVAAVAVFFLLR
jgi:hypothetical protein